MKLSTLLETTMNHCAPMYNVMYIAALVLLVSARARTAAMDVHPTFNCSTEHSGGELTLDRALRELSHPRTTLNLLPGLHCITTYTLVRDLSKITIHGEDRDNVTITCSPGNGLAFLNVEELTIEGVTISECDFGQENFDDFQQNVTSFGIDFFFSRSHANDSVAVACAECNHFTMRHSAVTDTNGLGFVGVNIQGNSSIENVDFVRNSPDECFKQQANLYDSEMAGGGAIFVYHDYLHKDAPSKPPPKATLSIRDCSFLYNSYCGAETLFEIYYYYSETPLNIDFLLGAGGGLSIIYTQLQYSVNSTISTSHFQNNTAKYGGGAHVQIFSGVFNSHVVFEDCVFERNGLGDDLYTNINYTTSGSALAFFIDFLQPNFTASVNLRSPVDRERSTMTVVRSNFTDNRAFSGGAVVVLSLFASLFGGVVQDYVLFDMCRFEQNRAVVGSAVFIQEWKQSAAQRGLIVDFKDAIISNNTVVSLGSITSAIQNSAVVEILAVNVTFRGSSTFDSNAGTAIRSVSGIIHFQDNVTFSNNIAAYAGAVRLDSIAILIVNNNTNVRFVNNSGAVAGGAILANFLATLPAYVHNDCFLYFGVINIFCYADITKECTDTSDLNIQIEFDGNTAPLGGVIYGSTLETCPWANKLRQVHHLNKSVSILEFLAQPEEFGYNHSIFKFSEDQMPNSVTTVTTPTSKINLETRRGLPIDADSPLDVVPGQEFNIFVKTLDHFGRPIPNVVTSRTSPGSTEDKVTTFLGQSNYWFLQTPKENDTTNRAFRTPVTVYGGTDQKSVDVSLFALDSQAQVKFAVSLRNCSPGFEYDAPSSACVCDHHINDYRVGIECMSNGELSVPNEIWIGLGPDNSPTITSCKYDYCQPGLRKIKLPSSDVLCRTGFHRTGVACGQCADNHSTIFGSNRCKECSNFWLFLIPVYLLLGVVIIVAICRLQITITEGYLNGMLLYSNIVSVYLPVFTFTDSDTSLSSVFVLISYLNLDWGIPTCFYDGMTALVSTALEFFFPLYLFVLMGGIVVVANRSKKFSNWFIHRGFSAAKLFATLIVMTYTSLLQTCVEILAVTEFTTFEKDKLYIQWKRDPSQPYFRDNHIPLGLIAILLLIFFLIPLPFLLIFPNTAISKVKYLQRFKPIFDAFWAPFKHKYRFWVGFRLLLRALPIAFLSFFPHPLNVLLLAISVLTLLWVQSIIQPFVGTARNAFDTFFLANILILTVGYLYFFTFLFQYDLGKAQNKFHLTAWTFGYFFAVVFTAYIAFTLIILWHVILRFPKLKKLPRLILKMCKKRVTRRQSASPVSFTVNASEGDTKSYGATGGGSRASDAGVDPDVDQEGSEVTQEKQRVVYSELREPLLESGSLEMDDVHPLTT